MIHRALFVISLLQLFALYVSLNPCSIRYIDSLVHNNVKICMRTLGTSDSRFARINHLTEYEGGWNQSKSFVYDQDSNKLREIKHTHVLSLLKSSIYSTFVPSGDINKEYFSFVGWRTLQRMISSINNVFGTQALLLALGIRRSKLGVSAVSSWVIKDALGKLFRVFWAGGFGRRFDSDAKQWRFRAAILYTIGNALEVSTLLFPSYFLMTAAVGNALKQVAMLTSSATRSSIYKTFSGLFTDNIGDITAKGEAQIAAIDLLGMFLGVFISKQLNFSKMTILSIFGILSLLDVFCVYKEIHSVIYRTLNFHRCSVVLPHILERKSDASMKSYLSPESVATRERLLQPALFPIDESIVKAFSSLSPTALKKYLLSEKKDHENQNFVVIISLQPIWNVSLQEKVLMALGWHKNLWLAVVPCTLGEEVIRVPCVLRSEVLLDRSANHFDLFRAIIISCRAALEFSSSHGVSSINKFSPIIFGNLFPENKADIISKYLDILADDLRKIAYKYEEIHQKDIINTLQQLGWSTKFFSLGTMHKKVDL